MIRDIIRNYILANYVLTLYLEYMPAEPDTCIAMFQLPSSSLDMKFAYSTVVLSFRSRSSDPSIADSNLAALERLLHGFTGTLEGKHITYITALQKPYATGRDEQQRQTFTQNFLIEYEDTNANRLI
jgi:Bacteriophage minor capsid protein